MKNKIILITGASKGLGLECVKFFLKKKYKVIAIGRDKKYIKNLSKKITFVNLDLFNKENRSEPALINPGDKVKFNMITKEEYDKIKR